MLRLQCRAFARPIAHRVRYISTPPPSLPPTPTPPKDLPIAEQLKADIRDAESRGILQAPAPTSHGITRFLYTSLQLLKFYLRGSKLIWTRQKLVKSLTPPNNRVDFRFLHRQRQDVKKVVPFLIMALVLEEIIPLAVVYVPSLLPSTCVLPSQRARIRAQQAATASAAQRLLAIAQKVATVDPASSLHSREFCQLFGLPGWGPAMLRSLRLQRHISFVRTDDKFLTPDDISTMTEDDLDEALMNRGLIIPFPTTRIEHKREILGWWLSETANSTTDNYKIALKFTELAAATSPPS